MQLFLSPAGEPFRAAAGQPYPSATWFARADRDRDGTIDLAETTADADRFFATLDHDHDGRLAPEEVVAYERDVAPEIAVYADRGGANVARAPSYRRSGRDAPAYRGPVGAGAFAWLNVPEPVAAADADVNRVIDRDEFLAAIGRRFASLDTAGRGRLRLADLPPTPQQQAIAGPCRPVKSPSEGGRR